MRHSYKKYKFTKGQDATQMILVKLATNFFKSGKLVVTDMKAKALRSYLERLIVKAKANQFADKNVLLTKLHDPKLVEYVTNIVAPAMKRETGFFKIEKLMPRIGDGANISAISYVDEVPTIFSHSNSIPEKNDISKDTKKKTVTKKVKSKK